MLDINATKMALPKEFMKYIETIIPRTFLGNSFCNELVQSKYMKL